MCKNSKRSKSVISGIICIVILIVMFFSIFYIAKEANHECTEADCPICLEIQACVQTLKTMGFAIGAGSIVIVALFCAALIAIIGKSIHVIVDTLVSLNVKLSN